MHLAAGQPPQQETVDGSERETPGLRSRPRAVDMIEQPRDLGGGKIRVEQQPGFLRDLRLVPRGAQNIADIGGAPVLPDDSVVDRLAGGAIPDDDGLALVSDADRGDILGGDLGFRHHLAHGRNRT